MHPSTVRQSPRAVPVWMRAFPTLGYSKWYLTRKIVSGAMRGYDCATIGPDQPRIFVRPARPQPDRSESIILLPGIIISRHLERILPDRTWNNNVVHDTMGRMAHRVVASGRLDVPIKNASHTDRIVIVRGSVARTTGCAKDNQDERENESSKGKLHVRTAENRSNFSRARQYFIFWLSKNRELGADGLTAWFFRAILGKEKGEPPRPRLCG